MPDVRLDPGFTSHPKIAHALQLAGPTAGWLFVESLCYSVARSTDGYIPSRHALALASSHRLEEGTLLVLDEDTHRPIEALITAGLWNRTDGGYTIHHFADYQVTKAKLERSRSAARTRMRKRRSLELQANISEPPHAYKPPSRSSSVTEKTPNPNVLPTGDLETFDFDAGLLGEIASSLRDTQGRRTLDALRRVSDGLSEQAIRDELEALQHRRGSTSRGPIRSECAWFVDRLKKRRDREAARDLAAAELLREIA